MNVIYRDVYICYVTGKKWYLVVIDGKSAFITEQHYLTLNDQALELITKTQEEN